VSRAHFCVGGERVERPGQDIYDAQGIFLGRACSKCRAEKLRPFRAKILDGYNQADVDEPIEPRE
jgi:hypothetical protein